MILNFEIHSRLLFKYAAFLSYLNYAKLGILSTSEAIAAALYILGYKEHAKDIMNKFKWGHTFIDLNHDILEDYSHVKEQNKIIEIEKEYFPNLYED